MSEPETRERGNGNGASANRSGEEPPVIPGLAELIEVINTMASAPPGVRPKLNQALLDRVKGTPVHPVLKALEPVYLKLGPPVKNAPDQTQRPEAHQSPPQPTSTPGPDPSSAHSQTPQPTPAPVSGPSSAQQPAPTTAAPDTAELKNVEAGVTALYSKLDFVSQAVTGVTTRGELDDSFQLLETNLRKVDSETRNVVNESAKAAKAQIEAVDKKISQMSGKLDPLAELTQGVKRLQAGLLDEGKGERARLETKNKELENQVKELQQVIHDTRAELLPVEVVSEIALQGSFSDEPDKRGDHGGNGNATPNLLQTAKKVRANTLSLVAKCRTLFAFINRDGETESDVPDLGKEGEWGRCAEHLRASNSKLRNAIEEKEESDQKLQFVGFVIEQIRKGRYTEKEWESDTNWKSFVALVAKLPDGFESIRLLSEDLSRLTVQATTPTVPDGPTSSTVSAGSNTSTAKPINGSSRAPRAPIESVGPLTSTPAVTAPSSPVVTTIPIPPKKEREVRPTPTRKPSSSIRIKMVFNPIPGPLYGWGPLARSR
ncbi:hypothetical protein M407DRAFT_225669 [Tulasnella calospora MUT 4182]|uniref:Uncharacterized protein n=1 Tax=Tulasnella calospora MUT 4182 TaxID=1051891 RepID=A0A0C3M8G7_9AGAM|nr:hypothetical protein M407DRAFT_225669 [Tulasnella calospora MUT 4182]